MLELLDPRCALIRRTLPRCDTFFQHLRVLTRYMCFESWQQLMLFLLEGLKLNNRVGHIQPIFRRSAPGYLPPPRFPGTVNPDQPGSV